MGLTRFHQSSELKRSRQPQSNLGLHVGKLLLDQLVGRERPAKLLAIHHVAVSSVPTVFSGADHTPRNPVAGPIEAAERTRKTAGVGEQVILRHNSAVQNNLAGE